MEEFIALGPKEIRAFACMSEQEACHVCQRHMNATGRTERRRVVRTQRNRLIDAIDRLMAPGLIVWLRLDGKLAAAETKATALHMKRQRLESRIALIRSRNIDEDMLDEQVRRMLNLIRPNEIVIYHRTREKGADGR